MDYFWLNASHLCIGGIQDLAELVKWYTNKDITSMNKENWILYTTDMDIFSTNKEN